MTFIFVAYIPIENPIPVPDFAYGPFNTSETEVYVGGFYNKDGSQDAWAFYPSADALRVFPVLSFSHGDGGGGFMLHWAFSGLLRLVASHGFVVVAHKSCFWPWDCGPGMTGSEQYTDQLRVLEWALGEAHGLPVDREKAGGVFGQSTGGRTSIQCAAAASKGTLSGSTSVGAAVALHPDPCIGEHDGWLHGDCDSAKDVDGPIAVFTSSDDTTEPEGSAKANFDAAVSGDKLFGSMKGVTHVKGTGPVWGLYVAAWMKVFLEGDDDYYSDIVYGSGERSVCGLGKEFLEVDEWEAACVIVKM